MPQMFYAVRAIPPSEHRHRERGGGLGKLALRIVPVPKAPLISQNLMNEWPIHPSIHGLDHHPLLPGCKPCLPLLAITISWQLSVPCRRFRPACKQAPMAPPGTRLFCGAITIAPISRYRMTHRGLNTAAMPAVVPVLVTLAREKKACMLDSHPGCYHHHAGQVHAHVRAAPADADRRARCAMHTCTHAHMFQQGVAKRQHASQLAACRRLRQRTARPHGRRRT